MRIRYECLDSSGVPLDIHIFTPWNETELVPPDQIQFYSPQHNQLIRFERKEGFPT